MSMETCPAAGCEWRIDPERPDAAELWSAHAVQHYLLDGDVESASSPLSGT